MEQGTFLHVVWACPKIREFWTEVVSVINSVASVVVPLDPTVLLLGVSDLVTKNTHTKLFIFYAAYYARKAILLKWKTPDPPTLAQWRSMIDAVLPLYKLTYMTRKCPKKFDKIWGDWVEL